MSDPTNPITVEEMVEWLSDEISQPTKQDREMVRAIRDRLQDLDGSVALPIEPTRAMCAAWMTSDGPWSERYAAMIKVTPLEIKRNIAEANIPLDLNMLWEGRELERTATVLSNKINYDCLCSPNGIGYLDVPKMRQLILAELQKAAGILKSNSTENEK